MGRNVGKSYKVAALKNFSKFFKVADEFAERRHSSPLSANCLSVFDHFLGLALKGFIKNNKKL